MRLDFARHEQALLQAPLASGPALDSNQDPALTAACSGMPAPFVLAASSAAHVLLPPRRLGPCSLVLGRAGARELARGALGAAGEASLTARARKHGLPARGCAQR